MEIKTEKTHVILLSDDELNSLRCFIGDAMEEGVWEDFDMDLEFIKRFHSKAFKAFSGRDL